MLVRPRRKTKTGGANPGRKNVFFFLLDFRFAFLAPKSPTHEQHFTNRCQINVLFIILIRNEATFLLSLVDLEIHQNDFFPFPPTTCLLKLIPLLSFSFSAKIHKRNVSDELHTDHRGHIPSGLFMGVFLKVKEFLK